jgi:hypothetical protein
MPRALRFPKALVRHSIAARINILSRQTLPLVPLNNINKPSVYSATAFSHQSRGVHVLKDHELKFGREKYPQTYADGFQVGLDRLLAILRTPSLGNNLRHLILYGSANVHFNSNSDSPSDHGISSEDIDRLKQAIERAGFEDPQERESILSSIARNPADFKYVSILSCSFSPCA